MRKHFWAFNNYPSPSLRLSKIEENRGTKLLGKFELGKKPENSGRKKGSLNKKSMLVKEFLEAQDVNAVQKLLDIVDHLKEDKQADVWLGLLPYIYPKLTSITVSTKSKEEEELEKLSDEELFSRAKTIILKRSEYTHGTDDNRDDRGGSERGNSDTKEIESVGSGDSE